MRSKLIAAVSALALTMPGTALMAAQQDADTGAGAETDIEAELETEGSMDGEADADVGADVDADADMDPDADAGMDTETDADTEAEAGAEAGATGLGDLDIEALMGATVESSDGEELGEVEEVIQQGGGQILIEYGGLLGLGAETKAVDVADMTFDQENEVVVLSMTQAEFEELPDYEGEE